MSQNPSPDVAAFLDDLAGVSDSTRAEYRYTLGVFESAGVEITNRALVDFSRWLERRRYAKATTARAVSMVRQFLTYLDAGDRLPEGVTLGKINALAKAARSKRRGGYKAKAPEPETPRVVTYWDDVQPPAPGERDPKANRLKILRNRALMHTLYSSGGRISEVIKLTRSQVASGRAAEVVITGKGDKARTIFLTDEARVAIRRYCDEREDGFDALFIAHERNTNGRPMSRATAWGIVKETARAMGLSASISPHSFRHFRATQLLNEGMPLESVQSFLGHAQIDTTRKVYAQTLAGVLREQVATYSLPAAEAAKAAGDMATKKGDH